MSAYGTPKMASTVKAPSLKSAVTGRLRSAANSGPRQPVPSWSKIARSGLAKPLPYYPNKTAPKFGKLPLAKGTKLPLRNF